MILNKDCTCNLSVRMAKIFTLQNPPFREGKKLIIKGNCRQVEWFAWHGMTCGRDHVQVENHLVIGNPTLLLVEYLNSGNQCFGHQCMGLTKMLGVYCAIILHISDMETLKRFSKGSRYQMGTNRGQNSVCGSGTPQTCWCNCDRANRGIFGKLNQHWSFVIIMNDLNRVCRSGLNTFHDRRRNCFLNGFNVKRNFLSEAIHVPFILSRCRGIIRSWQCDAFERWQSSSVINDLLCLKFGLAHVELGGFTLFGQSPPPGGSTSARKGIWRVCMKNRLC